MIKLEDSLQNVSTRVTKVEDKGREDKVFFNCKAQFAVWQLKVFRYLFKL